MSIPPATTWWCFSSAMQWTIPTPGSWCNPRCLESSSCHSDRLLLVVHRIPLLGILVAQRKSLTYSPSARKLTMPLRAQSCQKKKWKDKGLNTKKGQAKKQRKARVSLARGITSKPKWKPRHQTTSPSRTSRTPLWLAPRSTYVSPCLDQILSASPSSLLSGMWGLWECLSLRNSKRC